MFDLLIKYLSLDEREVFALRMATEKKEDSLKDELAV